MRYHRTEDGRFVREHDDGTLETRLATRSSWSDEWVLTPDGALHLTGPVSVMGWVPYHRLNHGDILSPTDPVLRALRALTPDEAGFCAG